MRTNLELGAGRLQTSDRSGGADSTPLPPGEDARRAGEGCVAAEWARRLGRTSSDRTPNRNRCRRPFDVTLIRRFAAPSPGGRRVDRCIDDRSKLSFFSVPTVPARRPRSLLNLWLHPPHPLISSPSSPFLLLLFFFASWRLGARLSGSEARGQKQVFRGGISCNSQNSRRPKTSLNSDSEFGR